MAKYEAEWVDVFKRLPRRADRFVVLHGEDGMQNYAVFDPRSGWRVEDVESIKGFMVQPYVTHWRDVYLVDEAKL